MSQSGYGYIFIIEKDFTKLFLNYHPNPIFFFLITFARGYEFG
jgi:hypothetical protein